MVVGMARSVHGSDSGAFDGEDLAIDNGLLGSARRVFVNRFREVRIKTKEVGNPAHMVTMPVGEQYMGDGKIGRGECGGNQFGPFWDALAGIEDEPLRPCSYDISVGTLEGKLSIR